MNLALRDIQHSPGRFLLTCVGLGMLLMIVMGMGGIYRGIIEDATLLADRVNADLWIVQRDTRGPFAEISRLPLNVAERALAVPGVQSAREFVYHTIQRERNGRPLRMAVLGLSWPNDKGEWLSLTAGRAFTANHFEMIADESLGLAPGEKVRLGRDNYTVVGTTKNMISSGGDGIAFFTARDALAIQFDLPGEAIRLERSARGSRGEQSDLGARQPQLVENAVRSSRELPALPTSQASAVMVKLDPGVAPEQVADAISAWSDVTVYSREQQADLLLRGAVEKVRRQIGLFRALLTVIAAIIMALILYTLTLDKLHSIALLKLIGAQNYVIVGMILQQALLLGGAGFAIAWGLGRQIFPNFPRRVILTDADLLQLAGIVLAISVVSSLLGIWKAMRVSPNEALS